MKAAHIKAPSGRLETQLELNGYGCQNGEVSDRLSMNNDHLYGAQYKEVRRESRSIHCLRVQTPNPTLQILREHNVGFQGCVRGDSAVSPGAADPGGAGGWSSALL